MMLGQVNSIKGYGAAKLVQMTGAARQKKAQAVMVLIPPAIAVLSVRANGVTCLIMSANLALLNKVWRSPSHTPASII